MRSTLIPAAGFLALAIAAPASAASYTDSYSFLSIVQTGSYEVSGSQTFFAFDTSLGELQSVEILLDSSYDTEFTFSNRANQTIDYTTRGAISVYYDGTFADFSGFKSGTATLDGTMVTLPAIASGTVLKTGNMAPYLSNSTIRLQFGYPQVFIDGSDLPSNGTDKPLVVQQSTQVRFKYNYLSPREVPEPASWAMMIAGFGLAGAALRRRPRPASA